MVSRSGHDSGNDGLDVMATNVMATNIMAVRGASCYSLFKEVITHS